ncbi:MAG: ThiF family adenylyltransferase [Proteobacteria bacterium]|nr:ThiF family adenylyltransferase [Pseudomonadota bacterium]MBU1061065.1 ThiF family adenylyltransferase [Pseudomonadota bacterium]
MVEKSELLQFLRGRTENDILSLADQREAASRFNCSLRDIEEIALSHSILPRRYQRNGLDPVRQLLLFHAKVAIIGCGGLGGRVSDLLARMGVGSLFLTDPDTFNETNLNRQNFCTTETLGRYKVEVVAQELKKINPILNVTMTKGRFSEPSVSVADLIVDGLDSIGDRHHLSQLCKKHSRPLIHAAVNKWYGQIGIEQLDTELISQLFPLETQALTAPHVLSPTVALLAAMQAAEVGKLILGQDSPLTAAWLHCDLLNCEYTLF